MKKNLIGIFCVILCLVALIAFGKKEKVEAETCTTRVYFLFTDISSIYSYQNNINNSTNGIWSRTHGTYFNYALPSDASDVSMEQINLSANTSSLRNGNINSFWYYYKLALAEDNGIYTTDDGDVISLHGDWYLEGNTTVSTTSVDLSSFSESQLVAATVYPTTTFSNFTPGVTGISSTSTGTLTRQTTSITVANRYTVTNNAANKGSCSTCLTGTSNDVNNYGSLLAPALYYVEYNVPCEPTPDDGTYKGVIHYFIKGTITSVHENYVKYYDDGETDEVTNPTGTDLAEEYQNCVLDSSEDASVTISQDDTEYYNSDNKRFSRDVYYTCPDPEVKTYTLTVRYWDTEVGGTLLDSYKKTELKSGQKIVGKDEEGIKSFANLEYDSISKDKGTLDVDGTEFIVTMPTDDVVVDIVYVPKTGGNWPIYIVWGIGAGALGYSVYYFNKYYKKEKKSAIND